MSSNELGAAGAGAGPLSGAGQAPAAGTGEGAGGHGTELLRILLVEDNEDDARLLERHLGRAGLRPSITRIETAAEMLRELGSAVAWDIVLADYNLPDFSAPEALALLKTTPFDLPFIMMSGAVDEESAVAAMRAGAHDYVSKQNLARLIPAIEREVAEARSRRSKQAAERALEQSEERFHRLVEATPLPLLMSDMQGRVVYVNAAVERLLGFTAEAAAGGGLTVERIFPPPDKHRPQVEDFAGHWTPALATVALATLSRGGETIEKECLDHAGNRIPVLLGAAILNPEAPEADQQIAAFLVDLTAQKRGEEVLRRTEKLAAAGRLAASIAHEINNPLEAITNCMYLLAQTALPEEAKAYLKMAQGELNRVTHISTQTLRFYRQNSKASLTSLPELFDTVLALYEPRLKSHCVEVGRDFAPVPSVVAFGGEIRQVLANLFGNALDALISASRPKPHLRLRIRKTKLWKTGEEAVSILVADNGIGMSPQVLKRIYEPFFSTKGTTGTGLGLWVSLEIVGKHHGLLRAHSRCTEPSGTVFRLVLPVHGTPEATPEREAETGAIPGDVDGNIVRAS